MSNLIISTEWNWATHPKDCYAYLRDRDANAPLDATCRQILTNLSNCLEPFAQIARHPLLMDKRLFNFTDTLRARDVAISTIWENAVFQGYCSVAFGVAQDSKLELLDPSDWRIENENSIDWLEKSRASLVLSILKEYSDKSSLSADELLRCQSIFGQILSYIKGMRPIFDCPLYKEEQFYLTLFSILNEFGDHALETRVATLFHAMLKNRSSFNTPANSPKSKESTPRVKVSPRENLEQAEKKLNDLTMERISLLPKNKESESCCALL